MQFPKNGWYAAIWSKDMDVLSTSQTAVAFGIKGALDMGRFLLCASLARIESEAVILRRE